eukprot:GHRQ01018211.1.p1 GENE.GHRQ01018211.1~~GHRQ01018211.1.p1  ORF type:complete len:173 (-),score=12.55 GHRQ01018211.1:100-618(-)
MLHCRCSATWNTCSQTRANMRRMIHNMTITYIHYTTLLAQHGKSSIHNSTDSTTDMHSACARWRPVRATGLLLLPLLSHCWFPTLPHSNTTDCGQHVPGTQQAAATGMASLLASGCCRSEDHAAAAAANKSIQSCCSVALELVAVLVHQLGVAYASGPSLGPSHHMVHLSIP